MRADDSLFYVNTKGSVARNVVKVHGCTIEFRMCSPDDAGKGDVTNVQRKDRPF